MAVMRKAPQRARRHPQTPKAPAYRTLDDLSIPPLACVNCFAPVEGARVFCDQRCTDEASYVRYARRNRNTTLDDVLQALKVRQAHALAGGYDKAERGISSSKRRTVIEQDHAKCRQCGAPGTDVDHINGSSNALTNLQWLCKACHNAKTDASIISITEGTHPEEWARAQLLHRRVTAAVPLQLCDSDEWVTAHKELLRRRRQLLPGATPTLF